MAEISDEQLAIFQRGMTLLQTLSTNPKTRRQFEGALKVIHPEIETSDDVAMEVAKPYVEQIAGLEGKLTEFLDGQKAERESAEQRRADDETRDAFSRLSKQGYTDDGLEKIKGLMVDRKIADPEAAAALFDRQNPKPPEGVASWEPDSWNLEERAVGNDVAGLFKNPDRWADAEVGNVLNEIRLGGNG